jgi:hypothetical protein
MRRGAIEYRSHSVAGRLAREDERLRFLSLPAPTERRSRMRRLLSLPSVLESCCTPGCYGTGTYIGNIFAVPADRLALRSPRPRSGIPTSPITWHLGG